MLAAVIFGSAMSMLAGDLYAATQTVRQPMFNGNRLAWCATWEADCGKPAADAWCRLNGFGEAVRFNREVAVGGYSPTRLIGTGALCDSPLCSGFRSITCIKLMPVAPGDAAAIPQRPPPVPGTAAVAKPPAAAVAKAPVPKPVVSAPKPVVSAPKPAEKAPAAAAAPPPPPPAPPEKPVAPTREANAAATAPATPSATQTDAVPVALASATRPADAPAEAPAVAKETKAFSDPIYKGRRLDWCRGWRDTCGKSTADEFCKLNGFIEAADFTPDPHIGARQPTRQIASGMVCDHELCDGFKVITCTN